MIALLIVPILICGYLVITSFPRERLRISLLHGWSLYLRSATIGFFVVLFNFILLLLLLPWAGKIFGSLTGWTPLPDTNAVIFLADVISEFSHLSIDEDYKKTRLTLEIISLSCWSIFLTLLCAFIVYENKDVTLGNKERITSRFLRKAAQESSTLSFLFTKVSDRLDTRRGIRDLFEMKSPIEYLLFIIGDKFEEDFEYNMRIRELREETFIDIKKGIIDTENKEEMESIFEELEFRELNFALITVENNKFYIGLPLIIPPPDEESIFTNSIMIVPVVSGYRNFKKSLAVTTLYDFDLKEPSKHDGVAIPRERIVSVSGFSFQNYERIKDLSENNTI